MGCGILLQLWKFLFHKHATDKSRRRQDVCSYEEGILSVRSLISQGVSLNPFGRMAKVSHTKHPGSRQVQQLDLLALPRPLPCFLWATAALSSRPYLQYPRASVRRPHQMTSLRDIHEA